jgi:tight adherence protein C
MSMTQILLLAVVFVSVAGLSLAVGTMFTPSPVKARLRQITGEDSAERSAPGSAWTQRIVEAVSPAGKLSLPTEGWEDSALRRHFMHAGFRGDKAPMLFFATKTILAIAFPVAFMLAAGISRLPMTFNVVLALLVGLAAIGYYLPNVYLRRRIANRQLEIFEAFPDAIDLMTVAVEAGLGLDAAIARVGQEIGVNSGELEDEIRLVALELRAGASREQALRNLAARTGVEEVELFVSMLVQSDRFGTSMAESLRVHSDALRTKRRLRAEEAAAKIPLKLLFPLIFCIFPSMLLVLLGPAVISIYRVFFPIAAG